MPHPSGGAAGFPSEAEGGIAFEVLGQKLACGFKFGSDHSEAVQPCGHLEFLVVGLDRLRAGALYFLGAGAEREAELDEGLQKAAVDPVLLVFGGSQEVPAAELDGFLCEGRVKVEGIMFSST